MQAEWAQGVSQWVARREVERTNLYLRRKFGLLGHSSDEWKDGIGEWRDQALLAKSWKWIRSSRSKSSRRKPKVKIAGKTRRLLKRKALDEQATKNPSNSTHASHISAQRTMHPENQLKSDNGSPQRHRPESSRPTNTKEQQSSDPQTSPTRKPHDLFQDEKQIKEKKVGFRSWMRRGALASIVLGLCLGFYALLSDHFGPVLPVDLDSKEKKTHLPNSANSEAGIFGPTHKVTSADNLEMIWVKPGTFMMGSPVTEERRDDDENQTQFTLTKGFYLGKHEVTQAQFEAVTGSKPSEFNATGNANRPVETVTWNEAVAFCAKLTIQEQKAGRLPTGWCYVLPTEAQWEYACRAGTSTMFSWGDTIAKSNANYNWDDGYFDGESWETGEIKETRDVGQYAANPWGFHDMHGNVWEWVHDWLADYPSGPQTDPEGPISGTTRVSRGGSWRHHPGQIRSAKRRGLHPNAYYSRGGFRIALRKVDAGPFGSIHVVPSAKDLEMLWVKPGTFMMGSPPNEKGRGKDEQRHRVTLTRGFYLGKYEVTQAQWNRVMGSNPSKFKGADRPVETIDWHQARSFCSKLEKLERDAGRLPIGWSFSLPTEAQWEYACRAGTDSIFSWSNYASSTKANFNGTRPYGGGGKGPYIKQTVPVGRYEANPWGFFDMHGNVWEWTNDKGGPLPSSAQIDPLGNLKSPNRIYKGGGWEVGGANIRSSERYVNYPNVKNSLRGFRLVLSQI